jgi:hypothetical protein
LASETKHKWLSDHGVIPVSYGSGVEDRIRIASEGKIDAFIDTFGDGYVELALKLGSPPIASTPSSTSPRRRSMV